jgi:hypothetical protein
VTRAAAPGNGKREGGGRRYKEAALLLRGYRQWWVPGGSRLAREVQLADARMLHLQNNGLVQRPVPTVTESLDRMVDAAQKVAGDEVALLRAEVGSAASAAIQSGAMLLLATAMLAIGWVTAMMAAFQLLAPRLGTLATLASLSVLDIVCGVLFLVGARWRLKELGDG